MVTYKSLSHIGSNIVFQPFSTLIGLDSKESILHDSSVGCLFTLQMFGDFHGPTSYQFGRDKSRSCILFLRVSMVQ